MPLAGVVEASLPPVLFSVGILAFLFWPLSIKGGFLTISRKVYANEGYLARYCKILRDGSYPARIVKAEARQPIQKICLKPKYL